MTLSQDNATVLSSDVARFLELVGKFHDVARSAHVTVLAHRSDNKWVNLTTLVMIGGPPGPEAQLRVEDKMLFSDAPI
jgi:hypothetical protein